MVATLALAGCGSGPHDAACDGKEGCPSPCAVAWTCAEIVEVGGDGDLSAALASARPGTCIFLADGAYGDVDLPDGAALLGSHPDNVTVGTLTVPAQAGADVCGVTIGGDGAALAPGAAAHFQHVRTTSAGDGVVVGEGSTLLLASSEIVRSSRAGIQAGAGATVVIRDSVVSESEGPGISFSCDGGCCAAAGRRSSLDAAGLVVRDNRIAGVALSGTDATLKDVRIEGTLVGDDFAFGQGGDGLFAECSTIEGRGLRIASSASAGAQLVGSGASLGGPGPEEGIVVTQNRVGVQIVQAGEGVPVHMDSAEIDDNAGAGVVVRGASAGVKISRSTVSRTRLASVPVVKDGTLGFVAEIGDGILWLQGSNVVVEDVALGQNARAGLLIDGAVAHGAARSLLRSVVADGNGQAQLLQQRLPPGGATPDLDESDLEIDSAEVFPVP